MAQNAETKSIHGWQKILPNQEFNSDLYERTDQSVEASIYETILDACSLNPPQEDFDIEQTDMFTIEEMASSPIVLGFLVWLIKFMGAKKVLEIGAFVGVSAMYFARALPDDGMVVTIEKFDKFAAIAKRNFEKNGLSGKINLICNDASLALKEVTQEHKFDMVFIDGNKERYRDYFELVADSVVPGGIVIFDDALFHGDVLNTTRQTKKGRGVRDAIDLVKTLDGWDKTFLPISNGIMILRKI